jgi:alkylhydroperoxidase family enzyme
MTRITGVDPTSDDLEPRIRNVFEAQARRWGAPLANHLIYARRPSIYHGARGMWAGLGTSALLDPGLAALVNRRVAGLNGCEF